MKMSEHKWKWVETGENGKEGVSVFVAQVDMKSRNVK